MDTKTLTKSSIDTWEQLQKWVQRGQISNWQKSLVSVFFFFFLLQRLSAQHSHIKGEKFILALFGEVSVHSWLGSSLMAWQRKGVHGLAERVKEGSRKGNISFQVDAHNDPFATRLHLPTLHLAINSSVHYSIEIHHTPLFQSPPNAPPMGARNIGEINR